MNRSGDWPPGAAQFLSLAYFTSFSPFAGGWPTRGAATGRKEFGFQNNQNSLPGSCRLAGLYAFLLAAGRNGLIPDCWCGRWAPSGKSALMFGLDPERNFKR